VSDEGIVNLFATLAVWQSDGMNTPPTTTPYKNHRFPAEIISHAVWLYFRFCLSFRDVEELLLERGIIVTYERSASGAASLANSTPISSVAAVRGPVTNGTSMKCCSPSKENATICGEPWISTGLCSLS
jgi:hypothetical protein